MSFDSSGRITDFGVSRTEYNDSISKGEPFETSGCPGFDGKTACNRPYGNEKPGNDIRNFPFALEESDIQKVKREIIQYD
jgi:biotin synthase